MPGVKSVFVTHGDRRNMLMALHETDPVVCIGKNGRKTKNRMVKVRCDCGKESEVQLSWFRNTGFSCGCANGRLCTKHGESGTTLYMIWAAIKQRCGNPKSTSFERYGGRGISVCTEWQESYVKFRDYMLNAGWVAGLEIDRIDNNDDYKPGNVRVVTGLQNSRNTRVSRVWTVNGVEYPSCSAAAKALGHPAPTVQRWFDLKKSGFSSRPLYV